MISEVSESAASERVEQVSASTPRQKSKTKNGRAPLDPAVAAQSAREGAARGMARRNQQLPWAWDQLTPVDLAEISDLLWSLPNSASALQKEAAFAVAAILTTGRRLSYLCSLEVVDSYQDTWADRTTPFLFRNRARPSWLVEAGSPGRQYRRRPAEEDRPERYQAEKTVLIPFPLSKVAKHSFYRLPVSKVSGRMPLLAFDYSSLKTAIEQMLRERRDDTCDPRRCSRTLESLERYLTRAITYERGGDIGAAARLTDSDDVLSRSVIHYGVSRMSATLRRAREATKILNRGIFKEHLPDIKAGVVGSPRCPSWADIKLLKDRLRKFLIQAQDDVERRHLAMTFYTVGLLSFALGHRGTCELLPGSGAVDPVTRFCKIHDKLPPDATETRLSWVVPQALSQILLYEEHLARTLSEIDCEQHRTELLDQMIAGRLPIFTLRRGKARTVSLRKLWNLLDDEIQKPHDGFRFFDNSGRHWLRAELEGEVSTETLHAFLGHWQKGCEPWSLGSCLDPLLYRADLQARLGSKFDRLDWIALDASGRPV